MLVVFTVAIMIIFCEWVLRQLEAGKTATASSNDARFLRKSSIPGLFWELNPGFQSEKYEINKAGFRGPVFPREKNAGVFRIACIGDSHSFGLGVYNEHRIYPALLQKRLAKSRAVEVLNFGVPGYNTWQEFVQLQNIVLKYHPDCVILGFVFNDSDGNIRMQTADGQQQTEGPVTLSLTSLLKQSYLVMAIKKAVENVALALFDYHPNYIDMKIHSKRWQEMKSKLLEMSGLLQAERIPLLIVVFPMTYQLSKPESKSAAQQDLLGFLQQNKIEFIDLFPHFRRFLLENNFDYHKLTVKGIRDSHPAAAGHEIVATQIVNYFQKQR